MKPRLEDSPETIEDLQEKFRSVRHDVHNTFAVLMALAELAERTPLHYERLAKTVLERCPKILADLQSFQDTIARSLPKASS